jgi:ABC-type branched-subunit amino acid transport system ATPase component
MLRCEGLTVRFGGLVPVDGLDLAVPDRGLFLIVGPNGAGKTTLLNVVSRITTPAAGSIVFDGRDLLALGASDVIEAGIARSFQKAELFGGMSALDNVLVGLHHLRGYAEREARARARGLLARLGLEPIAGVAASALPHGYQKLVDLARALVSEPKLLLLDEPFAGVTASEVPPLLEAITAAARERAVLMVEHHLELVLGLADRVTVLDFGRKISEGAPDEVRRDPAVIRSYLGGKAVEHAW